jgi:hypothetical protein
VLADSLAQRADFTERLPLLTRCYQQPHYPWSTDQRLEEDAT